MLTAFSLDNKHNMGLWDEFVQSHPEGTPYHLSGWLRTIADTYSFKPILYAKKDEAGKLTGVFPLFKVGGLLTGSRLVSLPFSDYGGPLFEDGAWDEHILKEILEGFAKRVKYVEIRSSLKSNTEFVCHDYYKRHIFRFGPDLLSMRKKINKRTIQYSIRKAERQGVEITMGDTMEEMLEFYRLNFMTRKKHGVPPQSKAFFKNLFENVISEGHGFILLAKHDSRIVAGSLFLVCGRGIHYKYNASDPSYLKKTTPNHLITWIAIRNGFEKGYEFMDFGRTSPDNEGLMRYKAMWGSECQNVPYYYYPQVTGTSSTEEGNLFYRVVTGIWKFLPDKIIEELGPMIYKHTA